ncbi:hypothetical protein RHGRI_033811 [Rhododendron griersonianum]|uniref:Uncharacterized protein n=1 Tax=Rhododendron griersonianum TaxID=479676 RepID=A0AAV6I2K6_9ERIC|nr:hypothetical protein RHGRI_033811 [Rhododendron griersonianum]
MAYAALGPPPNRGQGYPAKRPKYNEPPPLPVTAAKAQAFLPSIPGCLGARREGSTSRSQEGAYPERYGTSGLLHLS